MSDVMDSVTSLAEECQLMNIFEHVCFALLRIHSCRKKFISV